MLNFFRGNGGDSSSKKPRSFALLSSRRNYIAAAVVSFLFAPLAIDLNVTTPIHPNDVLPLLPKDISKTILYATRRPADLLPKFVGAVKSAVEAVEWEGACFRKSTAWLELHDEPGSPGGGTLHLKLSQPRTKICMDVYIFATPYRASPDYFFFAKEHTFDFEGWEDDAELDYVKKRGISVFLLHAGLLRTLKAVWKFLPMLSNSDRGEKTNIKFLEKNMGAKFSKRPEKSRVAAVNPGDIQSGDFLAISKIRGRWGTFQTLEKWVTGASAGHVAVCLRDAEGKLWVAESGRDNGEGEEIIDIVPWEDWWEFERSEDPASPHIALLSLDTENRAKFDKVAAWNYAKSMQGKPYGFQNLIFSWIDTVKENYPEPMDANLVASGMTIANRVLPEYAGRMWNEALNKRLGTHGLDLPEILAELERRRSTFGQLLTIPEVDTWVYSDGKSASCIALVVQIYKAAGLFGSLTSSVQGTEFTVRDGYTLKFFENDAGRIPKWCNEGDDVKLPFCQILGKYRMELPEYSATVPYSHMNERCPSLPPRYSRPHDC